MKVTVAEAKARLTVSEFKGWLDLLTEEAEDRAAEQDRSWKHPTPLVWYVIQLTQQVARVCCMFGGTAPAMADLVLEFTPAPPAPDPTVPDPQKMAARMANSKLFWGALAGLPVRSPPQEGKAP